MEPELPTEFDLIVIGTGIVESIVSAAASRIGKQVLHLDNNDYYGGLWASYNFEAIRKLDGQKPTENTFDLTENVNLEENEKVFPIGNDKFVLKDIKQKFYIEDDNNINEDVFKTVRRNEAGDCSNSLDPQELTKKVEDIDINADNNDKEEPVDDSKEAQEQKMDEQLNKEFLSAENISNIPEEREIENITVRSLLKESRKFNIDLTPKFHYARGDFIELMISSNIARYTEFRSCSRVLTWLNDQLELVPCSRSDVFSNDRVTVIEKRMLMKLLTACLDGDGQEFYGYENKTFKTFLRDRKLTDNLVHYVLYAIAMCDDNTSCKNGVQNTRRFLNSLGRFGKTPFIYSMYGSGEIPQAFCRLSAVFGGVYALNQPKCGLIINNEDKCEAIVCGKQRITAKHVVIGVDKMPLKFVENISTKNYISRAIFLIDKSIMDNDKENLTLLLVPPEGGFYSCTVMEMGMLTGTCSKDKYLVHMFTKYVKGPEEDLSGCVRKLFCKEYGGEDRPNILWSFYFAIPDTNDCDLKTNMPKNVYCCPGPDLDLDYDKSIRKARDIFEEMYQDEEFLPRAPNPEEIVIGEEAVPEEA